MNGKQKQNAGNLKTVPALGNFVAHLAKIQPSIAIFYVQESSTFLPAFFHIAALGSIENEQPSYRKSGIAVQSTAQHRLEERADVAVHNITSVVVPLWVWADGQLIRNAALSLDSCPS